MDSPTSRRPPLLAVGMISAAALAYEILLIRLFALVHWHELVAAAISLALLGYGASGTLLTLFRRPLLKALPEAFIAHALAFAVLAPLCVHVAGEIPFDPLALAWDPAQGFRLAAIFLVLALPFIAAANCIGLALTGFPQQISRLYGFDLIGAGIGALALLGGLAGLHPASLLLAIAVGAAAAAVFAAVAWRWRPGLVIAATVAVTLTVAIASPPLVPAEYKDQTRAEQVLGAVRQYQAHGLGGVVTVVGNPSVPVRTAPGLSLTSPHPPPNQNAVFVDGDRVGSVPVGTAGSTPTGYLRDLVSALPYQLLERPRVVVLNAGVGTAVRQALAHDASAVVAVESNPQLLSLVSAHTDYAVSPSASSGRLRWVGNSARAFIATLAQPVDLIVLPATNDPTGLDALVPDFDLTLEAVRGYLARLAPDGLLALELGSRVPPRLTTRLIATARDALRGQGVARPGDQVAAVRGWQRFVLLVARQPLGPDARAAVRDFADARGFDLVWLPDMRPDEANRFQQLRVPMFYRAAAEVFGSDPTPPQVASADDDRPFPHRFSAFADIGSAMRSGQPGALAQLDAGLLLAAVTLVLVGGLGLVLILMPLAVLRGGPARIPAAARWLTLGYFGAIGVAFLFIEIAWIQRLQHFLGQPVYTATVVLSLFLIFAGLGSLWSKRRPERRDRATLRMAVLTIVTLGLVYLLLVPTVIDLMADLPMFQRLLVAALPLAPLAFAMGIPFPLALRALDRIAPRLVPWAWGINGCASVIGAASAPLLAAELGFSGLVVLAILAYLVLPLTNPARAEADQRG